MYISCKVLRVHGLANKICHMTSKVRVVWSSIGNEGASVDSSRCTAVVEVKNGMTIGNFVDAVESIFGREAGNGFRLR